MILMEIRSLPQDLLVVVVLLLVVLEPLPAEAQITPETSIRTQRTPAQNRKKTRKRTDLGTYMKTKELIRGHMRLLGSFPAFSSSPKACNTNSK
jgi:hypothetical protein